MKKPAPYTCDICDTERKPSNGWVIAFSKTNDKGGQELSLSSWHPELADEPGAKHLCGQECISKHVSSLAAGLTHPGHHEEITKDTVLPTTDQICLMAHREVDSRFAAVREAEDPTRAVSVFSPETNSPIYEG
jgi:hypothetical protein